MDRNEVTLNRKALLGAVEMALRVQGKPKKGHELPPLLRCVAIQWERGAHWRGGWANVRATSMATWYEAALYPDSEKMLGTGAIAINAADLRDILRSSKAVEVLIRHLAERETVELEIGDATIALPGFDGYTFPAAPGGGILASTDVLLDLPMPQLRRLCAQASYPVPADADSIVAALVGVRSDAIVLSATDGHRLALGKLRLWTVLAHRDILIPAQALRLLATIKAECRATVRHLGAVDAAPALTLVEIGKSETLVFKSPDLGTFPGVEDLISRHRRAATAVVDRESLIGAVSRAAVVSLPVKLSLVPIGVEVASCAGDLVGGHVRERLLAEIRRVSDEADYALSSAVNSDYLLETLAVVDTDRVVLTFGWPDEPLHIAPFGAGCSSEAQAHLIMPMSVAEAKPAGKTGSAVESLPPISGEQLAAAMRESIATIPGVESVTVTIPGEAPVEVYRAPAAEPDPEPAEDLTTEAAELVEDVAAEDVPGGEPAYPRNPRSAEPESEPGLSFVADGGMRVQAGRYRVTPPSDGLSFEMVIRAVDGLLCGITPQALTLERNGAQVSPGVPIEHLAGYRFERLTDAKAAA